MLSPGLRSLLTEGSDNAAAIEKLARDPDMMADAMAVLPVLESEARAPAGPSGVEQVIGRRFVLYPQPDRSREEWAAWWADYHDVLAEVPQGTLEAAMLAWVRDANEFLPKPGQLYALTADHGGKEALAVHRIRAAQRWTPPVAEQPRESISAEDRASIRDMARSFGQQLPEPKRATIKPNYAQTDERGVSPELRALVERQRSQR